MSLRDRHAGKLGPLAAAALVLATVLGALTAGAGTADAAAGTRCYAWSGKAPYTSATQIVLFRGYYDIEWCGRDDRVTEFRVVRCEAGSVKGTFVKDADQDCRPRQALGGRQLRIYGDMWAYPTVGSVKVKGVPYGRGKLNVHYEMTVYPDGRITGTTGG